MQPTDVVKVRLQAQKRGAGRYTGVWHAYKSIGTDEGVKGLWKGRSRSKKAILYVSISVFR